MNYIRDIAAVSGFVMIVGGCSIVSIALAYIVGGVLLLGLALIGHLMERE
jgi:hypothetical protein